ncbi:uracil-DNA glycosylase [Candidatus Pelagibacter communis]|uniref:uracil-DNA glycosylase n=1 Tax=Pelagibacter ubique TaxID=198252 RepID=UPI00094C25BB|nr:uracil-DNA glycosylase [Candidatus Pelagibacter ubique]
MTKKSSNHSMSYKDELINSIEPNFVFNKKPLNRFKFDGIKNVNNNLDKINLIDDLKKQINSIENCNLKNNSKKLILGDGNIDSPIMVIGEAPAEEEEKTGKTFQGDSGALLEKMLSAINLKKNYIYSSYAINFRPPDDRKPTSQEIKKYSIYLKEHISIIDPKVIILFGGTAMESLSGRSERVSNERGIWKEIILKNKTYPFIITFSPSYLIRFPDNKKYSWEDLKKIRQKIIDLKLNI